MTNKENLIKKYIDEYFSSNKTWYIKVKYNEVEKILIDNWFEKFFISWSLGRWTSINPINDIDIICEIDSSKKEEFKFSEEKNIQYLWLLENIYNCLVDNYWKDNIKLQSHSIWILFWKDKDAFSIDIVPSIKLEEKNSDFWDNLYNVPEIPRKHTKRKEFYQNKYSKNEKIEWKLSDPKWYIHKAKQVEKINNNFIYASIFLKKWKSSVENKYTKFLKSFHIEEYIKDTVIYMPQLELIDLFKKIKDINLQNPKIQDRADNTINIDEYISENDFINVISDIQKEINILYSKIKELDNLSENKIEEYLRTIFIDKKKHVTNPIKIPSLSVGIKPNKLWSNTILEESKSNSLYLTWEDLDFIRKAQFVVTWNKIHWIYKFEWFYIKEKDLLYSWKKNTKTYINDKYDIIIYKQKWKYCVEEIWWRIDKLPKNHISIDWTCCLWIFDNEDITIMNLFNNRLFSFFYNQSYYKKFWKYIWEYSHWETGIFEKINEIEDNSIILKVLNIYFTREKQKQILFDKYNKKIITSKKAETWYIKAKTALSNPILNF